MRHVRRVGAAAAGVLAVVVLGTGCGGGSDDGASGAPTVVSETPAAGVTDTEPPFSTEDPYATEEPVYAAGPEGEIDQAAAEKGWESGVYEPSELVAAVCKDLVSGPEERGQSPAQWLAEGMRMEGDDKHILLLGIPKLCPKWTSAVKAAAAGKYERWFGDGTYVVSSKDADGIPPGTYRAEGAMENCYWERTTEGGEIIANNFATSARKITVTIRSSDGQFTAQECATWKPVK
ncbi:hypothetical protein [Streptomyces gardneri]|uniref:hypothetical protein n=1 Tax=Streptomyces gardneri TaxID=66892 RepID=UPI00368DB321